MSPILLAALIVSTEFLLTIFYRLITPRSFRIGRYMDIRSVLKGLVERTFITVSLFSGYPHALILFGTLKLATRLKAVDSNDIAQAKLFNDFYLIGNFVSIMAAMFYAYLLKC